MVSEQEYVIQVYTEPYLLTRFYENFNAYGPLMIIDTVFEGEENFFDLDNEHWQVAPLSQPKSVWIRNNIFSYLVGELSGAVYASNSSIYFSNSDANLEYLHVNLTRRLSEDDTAYDVGTEDLRRVLAASSYVSSNNEGTKGAGFIYAVDDSNIIL